MQRYSLFFNKTNKINYLLFFNYKNNDTKLLFYIFALSITTDMKKFGYLTVKDSYRCVVTLFLSF